MIRAFILFLFTLPVWADSYGVRVASVVNGDTIKVVDAQKMLHTVRLAGIDAPERKQPYGAAATAQLSKMILNKVVTLDCRRKDRYSPELCVVYLDSQDINLEQLKNGMAWWHRQYSRQQTPQQQAAYEQAERSARENRLGLWASAEAVAPWEWRSSAR